MEAEAVGSAETLLETTAIVAVSAAVVVGNTVLIAGLARSRGTRAVLDYYLLSVAAADLLAGSTLLPMAAYSAALGNPGSWPFGDFVCRLTGYLAVTLASVSVYTFMWIAVDRYMFVRKPVRYETLQTRTRCQCWILFTWITSVVLCSPPLLGFSRGSLYADGYICMLDLGSALPYSLTIAALVLAPSLVTVVYTYSYIFCVAKRCCSGDGKVAPGDEHLVDPDHAMCFGACALFWMSWLPWTALRFWEVTQAELASHAVRFWLLWLGISSCAWKLVVYFVLSPKLRATILLCCKPKTSSHHLIV